MKKLIKLKKVKLEDSDFILKLRNNKELNKYISETSITLEEQENWILRYKEREKLKKEFYFIIINNLNNERCGTVRLYNVQRDSATWGSFILNFKRPDGAAYEVIKSSLNFAFFDLGLSDIFLQVNRFNSKAIHVYEKFGFNRYKETKDELFYKISKGEYCEKI